MFYLSVELYLGAYRMDEETRSPTDRTAWACPVRMGRWRGEGCYPSPAFLPCKISTRAVAARRFTILSYDHPQQRNQRSKRDDKRRYA